MEDPVAVALLAMATTIPWADAEFVRLTMDYDTASIQVRVSSGAIRTVKALGYIGVEWVGAWDEVVIVRATVKAGDDLERRAVADIQSRYKELSGTGSPARNRGSWQTLVITFSDNSQLKCTASAFEEDRP